MKKTRFRDATISRLGVVLGATSGFAVVATFLLMGGQSWFAPKETGIISSMASSSGTHVNFYTRLKANSRSLVAVVHYLLEPEGISTVGGSRGFIPTNAPLQGLAAPTNSAGLVPTV
jgi:hypothetical protein